MTRWGWEDKEDEDADGEIRCPDKSLPSVAVTAGVVIFTKFVLTPENFTQKLNIVGIDSTKPDRAKNILASVIENTKKVS